MARQQTYQLEDGSFSSSSKDANRVLDKGEIVIAWKSQTSKIPATFALGTALHETGYALNERDNENDGRSTVTDGIFQLERSEAVKTGFPEANLFDLDDAATVFAALMEKNYARLLDASGLDESTALAKGLLGYLAWSHNTGLGHKDGKTNALESIQSAGLDWPAWVARNTGYAWGVKMGAYGTDCITGGPDWRDEFNGYQQVGVDDATDANPYAVTPTVDASTKSTLRLLAALAIVLLVLFRLLGRRTTIPLIGG